MYIIYKQTDRQTDRQTDEETQESEIRNTITQAY